MGLSNQQLIDEAIEVNHAKVGEQQTLNRYEDHLVHYDEYLASAHGLTFYSAHVPSIVLQAAQVGAEIGYVAVTGHPAPRWNLDTLNGALSGIIGTAISEEVAGVPVVPKRRLKGTRPRKILGSTVGDEVKKRRHYVR